jgi:molecular chaperone DnaK (HSP70)
VPRSRYIVGIDLGTTNTAVAYVDTRAVEKVHSFEVPQLVAPGALDRRRQLPSFVFLADEHDLAPAETALPWPSSVAGGATIRPVVGELARVQGARQPRSMIASAKSWLCHGGVDRHAAILPWGIEDGPKLSPVAASALVLEHVRLAWDHQHARTPDARFVDQEIILTVPASFDEAARELTLLAATRAGYGPVVLLEEPQAAFYAWMGRNPARRRMRGEDKVLVFDVGGGTTDFTVIAVHGDRNGFSRTAVGDHLLLGGDNIDLTLAKMVEARLVGQDNDVRRLDPLQWHGLVHACRLAKETLLSNPDVALLPIAVSGRSSKLIGSTLRDQLTRAELNQVLHDGFFPDAAHDDRPRRSRGGLHEFGLPYAADAGITRHLSGFLSRHGIDAIDAVLFNGGAMTPASLRQRVLDQIGRWQPARGAPRELVTRAPELAVAEGAAMYGLVRRGIGTRIGGGTPRAFYVGVGRIDGRDHAICLAAKGIEEGSAVALNRDFRLVTNRPVAFKLYSSSTRSEVAGTVIPLGGGAGGITVGSAGGDDDTVDLVELPPIVAALRAPGRKEVTVHLEVRVTELSALEIWCTEVVPPGSDAQPLGWRLAFDMRAGGAGAGSGLVGAPLSATGSGAIEAGAPAVTPGQGVPAVLDQSNESAAHRVADPRVAEARPLLARVFGGPADDNLARVMKLLEEALGTPRDQWNTATARALFDVMFDLEEQRKRSPAHEARWLHLCGFCLRPGTGAPLDDWRAKQMWRIFNEDLVHPRAEQSRLAWWITWRRIAGGLSKGHQHQLYLRLGQLFLPGAQAKKKWDEIKPSPEEVAEMLRCLANLERLSPEAKIPLGDELIRRMDSRKVRHDGLALWALSRLGARVPLYGPLNCVVPTSKATAWLDAILAWEWPPAAAVKIGFSIAQLSRRTGDRARDLDDATRDRIVTWLKRAGADRAAVLVDQIVALEAREEYIALGDTLPPGLHLVHEG